MVIKRNGYARVCPGVMFGLAIVMASAAAVEANGVDLYAADKGPCEIAAVLKLVLHDAGRDKDLPLRITHPTHGGPHPVIIWSHGATGSKDGYQPLIRHWASQGYVCIQPTHGDSRRLPGGVKTLDRRAIGRHWRSRPEDVSFIIDSLGEIATRVDGLADRMDAERIGVGGHSYGAHTTMLIAGVTLRAGRVAIDLGDERAEALLMISPQGPGGGLNAESYATMRSPTMMITGDNDGSPFREDKGDWRARAYELAPPGDKYLVWIDDAYHGFGGIAGPIRYPSSGADNDDHVAWVRSATTVFWDAHLKQTPAARTWLDTEQIEPASGNEVRLERK